MEKWINARIRISFVLLLLVIVGIAAWFFRSSLSRREIRNVLLISIDTCRDDYLSCYGYRRRTTANIDAIADEGVLFENVVTPVPLTLPAHGSMLTGTIPAYHGIHDNIDYRLAESHITLSEILKKDGFSTGAVISAFILDSQFGLNQGFDTYDDRFDEQLNTVGIVERRGEEVSRHANLWLQRHRGDSFFLFLHYYDPHLMYEPPEPFKSIYAGDGHAGPIDDIEDIYTGDDAYAKNLYAGEIAYTDYCIGQVIEKLKELDVYDSTLIIITSDHGEGLTEHDEVSHGFFIYQSTLRVPLIFKVPGGPKGLRITDTASLVDIVPTVCTALKISVPSQVQGRDLSGYFSKKIKSAEERFFYSESLLPTKYGCNPLLGLVSNRWKYIQTTRPELYDLSKDTHELHNLVDEHPQRARILQDRLEQILEEQARTGESDSRLTLDKESKTRLQSLGYVAGGKIDESFRFGQSRNGSEGLIEFHYVAGSRIDESFEFDQSKDDPKDLIEFHELNSVAGCRVSLRRYSAAKEMCEKMLEARPSFPQTYHFLGTIFLEEGDYEKAVYYYSKYLEFDPNNYEVHNALGLIFSSQKEFDESVKHYRETLRFKPAFTEAREGLGKVLLQQGKFKEAAKEYQEVIQMLPESADAHNSIGIALGGQGKLDEAIVHYTEALRINPDHADAHTNLGYVLVHKGNFDEAVTHFKETLRVKPDWVEPMNSLAWLLATCEQTKFRNPAEAVELAERTCELTNNENPSFLDTLAAAYAAAGKFPEAVTTAEQALKIAQSSLQKKLAEQIQNRLGLYKAGRPYIESSPKLSPD